MTSNHLALQESAATRPRFILREEAVPSSDQVREYLELSRIWFQEQQSKAVSGLFLAAEYTQMMDDLLAQLFKAAEKEYFAQRSWQGQVCALTSVGGYGRIELCPFSDVDLLFLYPQKTDAYMESIAERILYLLWDSGLEVGHSVRSIDQCVHLAHEDLREATSMLDVRLVSGEAKLCEELESALFKQVFSKKHLDKFLNAKIDELQGRHNKFGESVYLLEPNIKQGRGGLRDLNTIDWVLKSRYKMAPTKALKTLGLLSKEDLDALEKSKDNLFRLRFFLHLRSGRRQDVLDFESQEAAARVVGFQDNPQGLAVEQFMRLYYVNAATIERCVENVLFHVFPERFAPKASFFKRAVRRNLDHGLILHNKLITPGKEDLFQSDPVSMMALFKAMQTHSAKITPFVQEKIRANLASVNDAYRESPEVAAIFVSLLKEKKDIYRVLEAAHRSGFFSAYIPEFAHLYCLVLRDLYHIYTVDTHLLFAVQELEHLLNGKHPASLEMAAGVLREIKHFHVLVLAVLFHDIGKGMGKGHSERGAQMMPEIGRRLGLSAEETTLLQDLVLHHLLMAHTTQRRDIKDDHQVLEFCKVVKNVEMLRCLYVLTICDIRAVSPEVWSDWKGGLLQELYIRALKVFESGEENLQRDQTDLKGLWREVLELLNHKAQSDDTDRLFNAIPPRFLIAHQPEELARYVRFVFTSELYPDKGVHVLVHGQALRDRGYYELIVYTHDRAGLFAKITGVLASRRLNILGVETSTWDDGRVLDVFRLVNAQGKADLDDRVLKKVEQDLNDVIGGKRELSELTAKLKESKLPAKQRPKIVPARVHVRNDVSEFCTVIEVFAMDRLGLLYEISQVFSDQNVYIQTALISTDVDQVADVFYVKDKLGNKIVAAEMLTRLEKALFAAVEVGP